MYKRSAAGDSAQFAGGVTGPGSKGVSVISVPPTPRAHYKEYLVSLINSHSLDPAALYTVPELELVCHRYLPAAGLPPRGPAEDEEAYRGRLLKVKLDDPRRKGWGGGNLWTESWKG